MQQLDIIPPDEMNSLSALFQARVQRSPDAIAYQYFSAESEQWHSYTWENMASQAASWQQAFKRLGLQAGDRIAIILRNCPEWVAFDQAALGLGLITVPLYYNDRAGNAAYIMEHSGAKLLFTLSNSSLPALLKACESLPELEKIVTLGESSNAQVQQDARVVDMQHFLALDEQEPPAADDFVDIVTDRELLATIVYTSGTTGRPKGVMLSHRNILSNCQSITGCVDLYPEQIFLSFLPLSHMLERMGGYYTTIMFGCTVAFARAPTTLAQDLEFIRPHALVSVPRVYEQLLLKVKKQLSQKPKPVQWLFQLAVSTGKYQFEHEQGRAKWHPRLLLHPLLSKLVAKKLQEGFGGRLSYAICGGAALPDNVSDFLIGCGIPAFQGYGLTEVSPVVCVNTVKHNIPVSVGKAIPKAEIRLGENDEVQVKSPSVMMGYWRNEQATQEAFTDDGWYRSGDQGRIDEEGYLFITGRLKEIIVMANGEKVPPVDIENAILEDELFTQVMIEGEGDDALSALVVLDQDAAKQAGIELTAAKADKAVQRTLLKRIQARMQEFPRYAQVRRVLVTPEPWTVDNGLLTPTLKMKRSVIRKRFANEW